MIVALITKFGLGFLASISNVMNLIYNRLLHKANVTGINAPIINSFSLSRLVMRLAPKTLSAGVS